eukprot:12275413-Karenia_brevis.AAC.1
MPKTTNSIWCSRIYKVMTWRCRQSNKHRQSRCMQNLCLMNGIHARNTFISTRTMEVSAVSRFVVKATSQ